MVIETLINQALALDPNAAHFIAELADQTIEIHIITFQKSYYLSFKNHAIQLQPTTVEPINATLTGPLKAYLKLALTKDPHAAARLGLTLEGDPHALQQLQQFFSSLDIDWEEALSHWTGDIVAHKIVSIASMARNKQKSFFKSSAQMVSEYLKEESRILPTNPEIIFFMNEVDELHAATERLEARVNLLKEKL